LSPAARGAGRVVGIDLGAVVVGQARDIKAAAVGLDLVVAVGQLGRVGDDGADLGRAGAVVVGGGGDIGRRLHEEILALLAGAVDAELVLGIEGEGHAGREAADGVLDAVEGAAAKIEDAAQFAARERAFRQRGHLVAGGVADRHPGQVGRRLHRRQGEGLLADDDRLAVADRDVQRIVAAGRDGGLDVLVELHDELVALVEQVVGFASFDRAEGADPGVQLGDLAGISVDQVDVGFDLGVDAVADFLEAGVDLLEAAGQRFRGRQQRLARRDRGAIAGHVLHRRKEVLDRRRQARGGIGQQVVDLADLGIIGVQCGAGSGRGAHLLVQEFVAVALDLGNLGPGADEANAGFHRRRRGLHHALAAVAVHVGVGDVMAGRGQRGLCREQPAFADTEEISGHVCFLFAMFFYGSARRNLNRVLRACCRHVVMPMNS
jgi:hypothetical protein